MEDRRKSTVSQKLGRLLRSLHPSHLLVLNAGALPAPMDRTISDNRHAPTSPVYNSNANFHAGKMPFSRDGGHDRVAVPVPDAPPYRAHIGNISYDLTEEAVEAFLGHRRVVEILITRYREDPGRAKSCFVEFAEREDLVRCGVELGGRSCDRAIVRSCDRVSFR